MLFQSEIRRILEELGNNSMFDSSALSMREGNTELIIDEMILALEHMARRKVGALIVVENKIHLNDVIATGTRVDGIISQPLIENIFEPNTPLHDGAVVVRGDRVVAAAWDYFRNHLAQLEERASVLRLSCRSAVHHERPSSFV